jgi:hypothetical protein
MLLLPSEPAKNFKSLIGVDLASVFPNSADYDMRRKSVNARRTARTDSSASRSSYYLVALFLTTLKVLLSASRSDLMTLPIGERPARSFVESGSEL